MCPNLESSHQDEVSEAPETTVDSEQLSQTEDVSENYDDCSVTEVPDCTESEVSTDTPEDTGETYDDCEANLPETQEDAPELAEDDYDDFSDCGKEADPEDVPEASDAQPEDTPEQQDDPEDQISNPENELPQGSEHIENTCPEETTEENPDHVEEATEEDPDQVDEAAEENPDQVEQTTEETTDQVDEATEEDLDQAEETTEETTDQVDEATEETSDQAEETAEENPDQVDEATEENPDQTDETAEETADQVEETAEENPDQMVETRPLQERLDDALENKDLSPAELEKLKEEHATALQAKIDQRADIESARKSKFEEVLSLEKGTEEYQSALLEHNALLEQRMALDTQVADMQEQQTRLEEISENADRQPEEKSLFGWFGRHKPDASETPAVSDNVSTAVSLETVKDFESLSSYMETKYDIQLDKSIKQLDLTTVKEAIGGFEKVAKDYPDVADLLKRGITSSSGIMSCNGSELSFNPAYFSDKHTLSETCREMSEAKFWVANASPESIGVHEAAHGVEWALIQANPKYTSYSEKVAAWNNCDEAKKIVYHACNNLRNTSYGCENNTIAQIRSISGYAMKTRSETMAEAFADVAANGENAQPLSKEITRLTRVYMNKYKGGN